MQVLLGGSRARKQEVSQWQGGSAKNHRWEKSQKTQENGLVWVFYCSAEHETWGWEDPAGCGDLAGGSPQALLPGGIQHHYVLHLQ